MIVLLMAAIFCRTTQWFCRVTNVTCRKLSCIVLRRLFSLINVKMNIFSILILVSITACNMTNYNIPKACLLNRSPVPAMDPKSNRSGLWRHMLAELVAGWEGYVANIQTMSRGMIKLQLSRHFCRATWLSCRVGVTWCCDFHTFRSCNTCTFSLTTFAMLRHTT